MSSVQGEEYVILHKQDQLWWRAQDKHGSVLTVFTNPTHPGKPEKQRNFTVPLVTSSSSHREEQLRRAFVLSASRVPFCGGVLVELGEVSGEREASEEEGGIE